ncbi:MAG: hypothetical protein IT369_18980 [Candidatus Latescibacteria bacterium]|nr:hypothetical protein [Candidatus Latescibacterota bacterium]
MKRTCSLLLPVAGLVLLAALSALRASSRNIAPDAVSRATVWSASEGDLSCLQDGKVPPDPEARFFTWVSGGTWVFEWEEPLRLEKLRLYVGQPGGEYQIHAYLGGHLDPIIGVREPVGAGTASLEEKTGATDQWLEIAFPPGTMADNLQIKALGPAVLFEVEILVRADEASAVERLHWGQVKTGASGHRE